jgi:phosphoribosylformylglycinamidine synthase
VTIRKDAFWFGEGQSRVVVSVKNEQLGFFKKIMGIHPYEELGVVTQGTIEVDGLNWGRVQEWKQQYDTAIENLLAGHESEEAIIPL